MSQFRLLITEKMIKKDDNINKVLGVRVNRTSSNQVLKTIEIWLSQQRKRYVVTPNPEIVMLAKRDAKFRQILNKADMAIADGVGVAWAIKTSRVTGFEIVMGLCQKAAHSGKRVVFIGGRKGIAGRAAEKLSQKFPGLKIWGISGPERIEKVSRAENNQLIKRINKLKPDLLLVGFGQGKQERWIDKNLAKLKVKVAMGVGGVADQIVKPWLKAPKILQVLGLEWLWRLVVQPWRIRRQLVLIEFVWLVVKSNRR